MTAPTPQLPPLAWQPLEIPLRGGLAEQVADEILDGQGNWLTLHNVSYFSGGELRRRPGFAALSATGLPYVVSGLAANGRELLCLGAGLTGGAAYEDPAPSVYRYSENASTWFKSGGQLAPASLLRRQGARINSAVSMSEWPHAAIAVTSDGKYMCQAWRDYSGTTVDLLYRVIDLSTDTVVVADSMAASRIGSWADVVACGSSFWFVYCESGDTDVFCVQLPTSSWTLGAVQTVHAPTTTIAKIDLSPESSLYFDVVLVDAATPTTIELARVFADTTISVTLITLYSGVSNIECVACHAVSGSPGKIGFAWIANNIVNLDERTLNPPTWSVPWGGAVTVDNTFNDPSGCGVVYSSGGDWIVTYDGDSAAFSVYAGDRSSTYVRAYTSLGVARSASRYCHWTRLASKPFTTTDGTFVWVRHVNSIQSEYQQPGVVLLCVSDVYDPTKPLIPVANAIGAPFRYSANISASLSYPFNFRTEVIGANAYSPFCVRSSTGDSAYFSLDYVHTVWTRPGPHVHQWVEAQQCTNFSGSILSSYDGATSHEHSFLPRPWLQTLTVGAGGSGNIEGDAAPYSYSYCAVYVWEDDRGNRWVSLVSNRIGDTVDAAHNNCSITLVLATIGPTGKHSVLTHRKPKILVYRTTKNGSTYHYVGEVVADWTARTVSFVDSLADATISGRETVYTTGDILESWPVPSSRYVHSHRGRLWTISGDDDRTVWATRALVAGEAPAWSPLLSMRLDDASSGCVALASLDEKLVIFCRDRIYVAIGDGPNDQGAGEPMPTPLLVNADSGCLDPRSVVSTASGVWFLSRSGLCLLTRKLEVVAAGAPVQSTISARPDVLAAVHDSERSSVFWLVRNTAGQQPLVIVHDYQHEGAWVTWSLPTTAPVGLALKPGTLPYGNSSSLLNYAFPASVYRENAGTKDNLDADSTWITPTIETPWLKLGGLAGYQRVRELHLTLRAGVKSKPLVTVYVNHDGGTGEAYQFDSTAFDSDGYVDRLVARLGSQKCRSIKLVLTDSAPTGTVLATWGVQAWLGVKLVAGVRAGSPKVQGVNRV